MTIEAAKKLSKGDCVLFNNEKYKVLHVKELRAADTNEIYICVKCRKGTETIWLHNKYID